MDAGEYGISHKGIFRIHAYLNMGTADRYAYIMGNKYSKQSVMAYCFMDTLCIRQIRMINGKHIIQA